MIDCKFVCGEPLDGVRRCGWTNRRCGSLITAVLDGKGTRYGLVSHFIERKDGKGGEFAVMKWLARPSYPYGRNPIVVRLCDGDTETNLPAILSICDIDPTSVGVSRCDQENCYYVHRLRGTDTIIN